MKIYRNTISSFGFGDANREGHYTFTHETKSPDRLEVQTNTNSGSSKAWINRDRARELAAILSHFADTGELKETLLPGEGS